MLVQNKEDDLDELKDEVLSDMKNVFARVDKSGEGVYVQASTLGSLEALLEFLKSDAVKIPVAGIAIGPVNKRDVMGASVMHERKRPEFATILAFDVKVTEEATRMANELNVKVFTADIIYHLFDQFTAYMAEIKKSEEGSRRGGARVLPVRAQDHAQLHLQQARPDRGGRGRRARHRARRDAAVHSRRRGTSTSARSRAWSSGTTSRWTRRRRGRAVAMKIQPGTATESSRLYGRHFDHKDMLVSRITRQSIDMLKENFRDELGKEDWRLVVELKKKFENHYGEPM